MTTPNPLRHHPDPTDNGTPPASASPLPDTPAEFIKEPDTVDVRGLHAPILRELAEPRDGYEPVPVWLIFCFFGLIGWGGWYLDHYSGGWSADVYNEKTGRLGGGPAVPVAPPDPLALGKRVFMNCQTCHQANGLGVAGNYPPLDGSEFVQGPPEVIARIILDGFEGPVTVKGQPFNNRMPPWRATLSNEQVAAVITYIRQAWGNKAPPVTPDMIAAIRKETASHIRTWSAPELAAIKPAAPPAPMPK